MKKDFIKWHVKKADLDDIGERPFFHEREIWFCYLGANVGFEQDGSSEDFLRPIVVIRKFNDKIFWGIPLTKLKADRKINKKSEKYYHGFSFIVGVKSVAILSQIRLIDSKRLATLMGTMSVEDFKELKLKLKALIP
jgi:mRNA interferase MazF